jgi:hypothetical protein
VQDKASRYQRMAGECVRLAQGTDDPTNKALLLQMAQTWVQLARQKHSGLSNDGPDDEHRLPKSSR